MGGTIFWVLVVCWCIAVVAVIGSLVYARRKVGSEETPVSEAREILAELHTLKVYPGPRNGCNACLRVFKSGEVITVADDGKLAFCYTDGVLGGCLFNFMMSLKPSRMLSGSPYVYKEYAVEPREGGSL